MQDALEHALSVFAAHPVTVVGAGRTDAGVHGINQVVHIDTSLAREAFSWVRGTNTFLPADIAVQWAKEVGDGFHARYGAVGRRYTYIVLQAPVRPALEFGQVGWIYRPLDLAAMQVAAAALIGEHDFSSFRSSQCQSRTPVKRLREIRIARCPDPRRPVRPESPDAVLPEVRFVPSSGPMAALGEQAVYWRFDFEGQAFLHHMVRNIMGCLLAVGTGAHPSAWMQEVLEARNRVHAAPTFAAAGLYFVGPSYHPDWGLPNVTPAMGWLPDF